MSERARRSRQSGLAALLLAGALLALPLSAGARVVERIVAVVNNEIVLLSDLNERLAPLMPQLRQIPDPTMRAQKLDELRRQALDRIIDEKLIEQEAAKLKLTVSDQDLERAIADVMAKNNLTREGLEEALKQEGKTIHAYKHQILRPQLLRLRVINIQVRSRVSVSDDELRALYQKNLRDLGVETKVRARHIFFALPEGAGRKERAAVKAKAQKVLALAKKEGADFAALAREYSEDPVTREDGGDLGTFGRGVLPSGVEDAVFAMKEGEVRGPLATERGFHIVKVVERKESSARSFAEVKDQLRQTLYGQKMESATQAWLAEVRKRSHIDIRL